MNAREQAREATWAADEAGGTAPGQLADAASDVWEPLVRDLLNDIETLSEVANHTLRYFNGYKRAVKALGQ